MFKFKKTIGFFIVGIMMLFMFGCGNKTTTTKTTAKTTITAKATTTITVNAKTAMPILTTIKKETTLNKP